MNAELTRRCVRAMTETGEGSLVPLCRKIVRNFHVAEVPHRSRQTKTKQSVFLQT